MLNSENILFFVCGLGMLQGILLAALVNFHAKSDRSVNKYLALYIVTISIVLAFPFTVRIFHWHNSFYLVNIPFLTGPFLYLYLRSFKEEVTFRKSWPHFLPFAVFFAVAYFNMKYFAEKYPDTAVVPAEALQYPVTVFANYIKFAHSLIYYFISYRTLRSYQRSILHLFSDTSRIDLHWASLLVHGFLVILGTGILMFSLMLRFPEHFNMILLSNLAVATPYIYIITYKGVMQPTIWQIQPGMNKETVQEEMQEAEVIELPKTDVEKPKYQKTGLPANKIEEIITKVISEMELGKIYRAPELTLQQLADKLEYPSYQVSQAINDGLKKNFYDLVNGYRVEEAKRLLMNPKSRNYTILSVGLDAGFNSKTTFNTVFKKFTGMTPSDYREKQLANPVLA
jgi:AraC-like DNA-binding protein